MSKKKWIIVIISILIIIIGIITIGLITVSKRKDNSKVNNPKNEKQEEIIEKADDKKKEEETETATPQEEPIQEEAIDNTIDQNPPATINSNNNKNYNKEQPKSENNNQQNIIQEEPIYNPPEPVNPPPKTYSCPPDYTLNGTQCITSYPAITSCPEGTHNYSDGTLSGCVNMNEGYFVAEDDTCLEGYGMLMIVSLFEANKYKCLPIHPSIVNCNEGYTLQESTCTKVIPATEN